MSQLAVWEVNFPGGIGNDNIKWRAFVWAISELMLFVSITINYVPPRWYKAVFRFTLFILMLDFFLCPHLAPDRRPQHLQIPLGKVCLYFHLYVQSFSLFG